MGIELVMTEACRLGVDGSLEQTPQKSKDSLAESIAAVEDATLKSYTFLLIHVNTVISFVRAVDVASSMRSKT